MKTLGSAAKVRVKGWNYCGDMNLECGGTFYKYEDSDYCEAVEILPASEMGGPDNGFLIVKGSIYFSEHHFNSALDCIGFNLCGPPELREIVQAFLAYSGIERDAINAHTYLSIGKPESVVIRVKDWNSPDIQLRGNAKLHNAVLEFLN